MKFYSFHCPSSPSLFLTFYLFLCNLSTTNIVKVTCFCTSQRYIFYLGMGIKGWIIGIFSLSQCYCHFSRFVYLILQNEAITLVMENNSKKTSKVLSVLFDIPQNSIKFIVEISKCCVVSPLLILRLFSFSLSPHSHSLSLSHTYISPSKYTISPDSTYFHYLLKLSHLEWQKKRLQWNNKIVLFQFIFVYNVHIRDITTHSLKIVQFVWKKRVLQMGFVCMLEALCWFCVPFIFITDQFLFLFECWLFIFMKH